MTFRTRFVKWANLGALVPEEFNQNPHGYPKFFTIETALIGPIGGSFITAVLTTLLLIGLDFWGPDTDRSNYSAYLLPFYLAVTSFALIQVIHILVRRRVSTEEFDWMFQRYVKLGLPKPDKHMTKLELKVYVEKAYKLESEMESFFD